MKFSNIKGYAVQYKSDVAIYPTDLLPEFVQITEEQIAKAKSGRDISTQSIGLNPAGCSGYFIGCINPTSNYLWTVPVIPYVLDNSLTSNEQTLVTASINRYNAKPGLRVKWQPRSIYTGVDRNVVIRAVNVGTQYCGLAYIGYQGKVITAPSKLDFININRDSSCFDDRTIHHEMGHVAGSPHEQTRCDRDSFITFRNGFSDGSQCGNDFRTYGPFDFASIMLYDYRFLGPKRSGGTTGGYIGSSNYVGNPSLEVDNSALTSTDIATLNGMYAGR